MTKKPKWANKVVVMAMFLPLEKTTVLVGIKEVTY